MLRDESGNSVVENESASTWAPAHRSENKPDWHTVDRALRAIKLRRATLDAEEARWLREAETLQIWRPLGMVSALDYLERALGYAPRTAQERLRVARALGSLPVLTAALESGEFAYSAVRELTRVATPGTEAAWVGAATGKSLRQIEALVADHRPGDRPDDPPDPEARTHVVRFEVAAETFALVRQARMVLDSEHGTNLPDDEFIAALCGAVLDGASARESTGRAKFQIAVTVCERCRQGWQEGAGAQVPIDAAAVDRALCDAQHIGSIDGATPTRAHQDIPPRVARFVWRRDGGRCRVDGCRSARAIEVHHIVHRAAGGSHAASNLILLCSACHAAHHRGTLVITGTAKHLKVRRPGLRATGGASRVPHDRRGRHASPARANSSGTSVAHAGGAKVATAGGAKVATAVVAKVATTRGATHMTDADARVHVGATHMANTDASAHVGATHMTGVDARAHVGATHMTDADASVHVGATQELDAAILRTQAKAALTGLGWKPAIAHAAVAAAMAGAGANVTLEQLIRASLRYCPVPRTSPH
jgi:HNH endonuclease/RuvA, C-terminal domain